MLEAAIIGWCRSTPAWFSMRRRILRLRRFNWRWTLAFTRKPPGGDGSRGVNHLDCPLDPGGVRVSWAQRAWGYAWLRVSWLASALIRSASALIFSALAPASISRS